MIRLTDKPIFVNLPLKSLFSSLLFLFLANSASASESRITVYAELNEVDSQVIEIADGTRVEGRASLLVRTLLSNCGYTADIRVVPWARLMQNLQTEPNVLGLNVTRTPEREEYFHWLGEIRPVAFKLWGLRERLHELPRSLDQARDFRISAYRGDVVEQHLLARGFENLVYVSDNYNSFAMLQRGRIDMASFSELEMAGYLAKYGHNSHSLVPVIDLDEVSTAQYLIMSKNSDAELVQTLNNAFLQLIKSGEHQRILAEPLSQPANI